MPEDTNPGTLAISPTRIDRTITLPGIVACLIFIASIIGWGLRLEVGQAVTTNSLANQQKQIDLYGAQLTRIEAKLDQVLEKE